MKTNILCYTLIAIIILFPIINSHINNIRIKDILKKVIGCLLWIIEICLIILFLKNSDVINISLLNSICFMILGMTLSILTLIIKNYSKSDMLCKLIKFSSLKEFSNPMVKEIAWGLISCGIEEIVWRGMIQNQLLVQNKAMSIVITSMIFAISHIRRKISYYDIAEIFVISCLLGIIWIFTKNILYCILFHWMRNNVIIFVSYKANKLWGET